ncbi:MAG TPA: VWA domain-containing protein [Marinagarivorans sp.]
MKPLKKIGFYLAMLATSVLAATTSHGATIAADGGITLYLSYDDATSTGVSWNSSVIQTDAGCSPTNNARAAQGAPNSPGNCPSPSCIGRNKLQADIQDFAEYVYQSTHGAHYIRRVYLSDEGRAWNQADVKWSIGSGGSSSPQGWAIPFSGINMRNTLRSCIHDVFHHEFGHYFYNLPDRYARSAGYYQGRIDGGASFPVSVDTGDPNTVMAGNFPHFFVDTTNAEITVSYTPPGGSAVAGEVLTPALLADADPDNDGPDRAHHGHNTPFAQDEWSLLPSRHADLTNVHTEGDFDLPDMTAMPEPELIFLGEDTPHPGTVLLLDRSGSMGVPTNGVPAVQFVQEAGMYLYHSALPEDYVGTQLYNASVETLFNYEEYDPSNTLPSASFRTAIGLTNIAAALESAIDTLIAEHGEEGAHGGKIVLMSDGVQTTGASLWDQVTRAEENGIEIHTLSFGSADTATMEAIATTTGGEVIAMSEKTDASELKLTMARELSELRGMTPLHFQKDILKPNADGKRGSIYEGRFHVPPLGRSLQFYAFLEKGNAAEFPLELIDPAGNVFNANPQNVAKMGRLNGVTVHHPKPGTWTFRINGSKRLQGQLPSDDFFELVAYTRDLNLDTLLSVTPTDKAGVYTITGQLTHMYPLMNIQATAKVYSGKKLLATLPMIDNGKAGIDPTAKDGQYSTIFDARKMDSPQKVRVDIEFKTHSKSTPASAAHYETGTSIKALAEQYAKLLKMPFSAFATDTVVLEKPEQYQPRIVNIEPRTPLRAKPGTQGKLVIHVENALFTKKTLRASLGQGIETAVVGIEYDKKSFSSRITLSYRVTDTAYNGYKSVTLQNNRLTLDDDKVLYVEGGKYYGLPLKGSDDSGKTRLEVLKREATDVGITAPAVKQVPSMLDVTHSSK